MLPKEIKEFYLDDKIHILYDEPDNAYTIFDYEANRCSAWEKIEGQFEITTDDHMHYEDFAELYLDVAAIH